MYKAVDLITTIADTNRTTSYLYFKPGKLLLPITTIPNESFPTLQNTLVTVIKLAGFDITCIRLYLEQDGVYYAYLTVSSDTQTFDIHIHPAKGLALAQKYNLPIIVTDDILAKEGIFITKELLMASLENI